jgi:hypothetical protein
MPCHLEPQQLPPANAHIDSGDRLRVVPQKCFPGLRRRRPTADQVFRDRRLSDLKTEHQELAMDSRRTPQRVFLAHPLDQITQAVMDYRPALPYFGISNARNF